MKEGWKYERLGNVCDILDGKRKPITKNKRVPGSIPYYGASGVLDYVRDYIFDEKLVLLGEDGAKWGAGEASSYIIEGKTWVNNHAHALRPKRQIIIDEFLTYFLNYSNLLDYITGVTVPKLNQEKMRSIPIPLPSLSEQERIVAFLDAEFEKIDQLKANAAEQLQAAKDLFQNAVSESLSMRNTWESKKLKDLCSICGEYGLNESATEYNGVRYLRITDITADGELNDDLVSSLHTTDKKQSKLEEGDILFARTGATVGKTLVYREEFGDCEFAGYLIRYRTNPHIILPKYLFYVTHSADYYKWVIENQTTATQPNISAQKYNSLIINFPHDVNEQQKIIDKLDNIFENCKQLQSNYDRTLTLCNDLKQALLKSIFA